MPLPASPSFTSPKWISLVALPKTRATPWRDKQRDRQSVAQLMELTTLRNRFYWIMRPSSLMSHNLQRLKALTSQSAHSVCRPKHAVVLQGVSSLHLQKREEWLHHRGNLRCRKIKLADDGKLISISVWCVLCLFFNRITVGDVFPLLGGNDNVGALLLTAAIPLERRLHCRASPF